MTRDKSKVYDKKDNQSWTFIVQSKHTMITFQSVLEAPGDHWRESSGNTSICTQVCNGSSIAKLGFNS